MSYSVRLGSLWLSALTKVGNIFAAWKYFDATHRLRNVVARGRLKRLGVCLRRREVMP